MFLDKDLFSSIVKNTPLIAIELVIQNKDGEVLLGKRKNAPAKNIWFVPGGRIYKSETLADAFSRTLKDEISVSKNITDAQFHGVYEHHYDDNFMDESFKTHYVCLAFKIVLDEKIQRNSDEQHQEYKWFKVSELLESEVVHQHTKDYFIQSKGIK